MKKQTTFFSYAFGCRVNEAEKEVIDQQLLFHGFKFDKDNPDIYIINTCSVTHKAEREARQLIYQIKRKLPKTKIVVTGCSATYWLKNNSNQKLPVDLLVDNVNKAYLVELIKKRIGEKLSERKKDFVATSKFLRSKRMMIKIQDGCQRFCSFCIVPYLRGLPKSEKIQDIIKKINHFKDKVNEVILTAINTQAFGYDTNESFVELLKKVIDDTSVKRVSLGSVHPWSLNDDFFEFYQNYLFKNRLVNFFHIPIQSGSNKILKLMKRDYSKDEILEKINKIKKINPFSFIGTDIIVGFLDEEKTDFEETYKFLKQSPINRFHVFRFSVREKTAAFYLKKRLKEPESKEKEERSKILINLSKEKFNQFLEKNVNRYTSVLILDKKDRHFFHGLTDNQLPIVLPKSSLYQKGEIVEKVKIVGFKNSLLLGKIV